MLLLVVAVLIVFWLVMLTSGMTLVVAVLIVFLSLIGNAGTNSADKNT